MLTLHHFTSPLWFSEKGGFTSDEAPRLFAEYTRRVVRRLGARVPLWCTLNEPMVLVAGTYLGNFMPPGKYSPKLASKACEGLLKSHVEAYRLIHRAGELAGPRTGPWRDFPVGVGIAHNMIDFVADRPWHPIELTLAAVFRRFYNRAWLDAITGRRQHFGVPGIVPYAPQVREALSHSTADFIGINYYTKGYVKWRPPNAAPGLPVGLEFARSHEKASDLQWAVHPAGLGRMLRFASRYGLPIYITENGIADADDDLRPDYLRAHLEEVRRARAAGIDVRGYYHWSLLDNFEWHKGFGPRFGLYHVDYNTFERTPTQTARLYRDLIRQGL